MGKLVFDAAGFQPAEDKAIERFIAMVRGPAGTGKSTILGSAHNAGHGILVADTENKGWGKYPRFTPADPGAFDAWMAMILDILNEPMDADGYVHLQLGEQDLAIDTLAIDTLDRLQDILREEMGAPGRDGRSYWGKLLDSFAPLLSAIDRSDLNVIIISHVQEKTPTIAAGAEEKKLEKAAGEKSADLIRIGDVNAADLGYGIYDYAANSIAGGLGRKLDEHMHCIFNLLRTPDGVSILAVTDTIVNGVLNRAKDDFGIFQRQNVELSWHPTDAVILGDPLGPLWAQVALGKSKRIEHRASAPAEAPGPSATAKADALRSKILDGWASALAQLEMRKSVLGDRAKALKTLTTRQELLDAQTAGLKHMVRQYWAMCASDLGLIADASAAKAVVGPIVEPLMVQLNAAADCDACIALAVSGADLIKMAAQGEAEDLAAELEPAEPADELDDDEIPF